MKKPHFGTKTASIRTIALLLLLWAAVSFTAAAEPRKIPMSNGSVKPTAPGDWPQAFFNAAHTGKNRFETQLNRRNVPNLTQLWASPVGVGVLYTSPVVSNGKVYIGSGDLTESHMYAFDALTGATLWVGAQQSHFFLNSAAVGHGLVFATAYLSPLTAYDADTGEIAWTSDLPDMARAAPVLNGSVLYVAGFEGQLYALDARTGSVHWSTPEECCIYDYTPTVSGDRVFQNRSDSMVRAYDAQTGEELWHKSYGIVGSLTAANKKLFVPADPNIVALDQATGNVVWSAPRDNSIYGAPAVGNGLLFVPQGSGMKAFDLETGTLVWTAPTTFGWTWGPAVANGVVYASNLNGEWIALDARDGTELWSVSVGGANGAPAVANGVLYLPGPGNVLSAYSVPSR